MTFHVKQVTLQYIVMKDGANLKKFSMVLMIVCLISIALIGCQKKAQEPGQAILGTWIGKDEMMGNVEFTKDMKFRIFDNSGAYDDLATYALLPDGKLTITFQEQTNTFQYEIKDNQLKIFTLPTAENQNSQTLEFTKASKSDLSKLQKTIADNKKKAQEGQQTTTEPTGETVMPKASDDIIVFETTMGTFKIELYPEAAPKTVQNFYTLVNDGFYNGIIFHRVIPDFMVQWGGVREDGSPKNSANTFEDEINPTALGLSKEAITANEQQGYKYNYTLPSIKLVYGVLAMANAGPNTNGSQVFVITKKDGTDWLNGKHTGFGKVIEGMEIAEKIQAVPRDESDKPNTNVVIKKAYVTKR